MRRWGSVANLDVAHGAVRIRVARELPQVERRRLARVWLACRCCKAARPAEIRQTYAPAVLPCAPALILLCGCSAAVRHLCSAPPAVRCTDLQEAGWTHREASCVILSFCVEHLFLCVCVVPRKQSQPQQSCLTSTFLSTSSSVRPHNPLGRPQNPIRAFRWRRRTVKTHGGMLGTRACVL